MEWEMDNDIQERKRKGTKKMRDKQIEREK